MIVRKCVGKKHTKGAYSPSTGLEIHTRKKLIMSNIIRVRMPKVLPPLTGTEKQEIANATKRPINYDDIPPLSDEDLKCMRRVGRKLQIA